ncbi:MAG: deoxyribonuclease IV [Thermodesulfobacteriota bacterium]|nr:deoxyribonuclease IV [Thermodesulfobacteriota bacterium]
MAERTLTTRSLLGAHMSISGGLEKALIRGHELGCNTIQMFTKNSNQWKERVLKESEIQIFREVREQTKINPVISHASYLINLASPDERLYKKSLHAMQNEIHRCELLGINCLVVHPGFHKGYGEAWGISRIKEALNIIHSNTRGVKVRIAIETTAGQGTSLGCSFQQIARVIEGVKENYRLVFCLDTCHIFASGYDVRTRGDYLDLFKTIEATVGMEKLKVLHLNDSIKGLGSRIDRHQDIGKGMIGTETFRLIMKDEVFKDVPKIIETPNDIENLRLLSSFV